MHLRDTIRNLAIPILFFVLLAYFVFGKGWYAPATFIIQGAAPDKRAELEVSWDSGADWNAYEQRVFSVHPPGLKTGPKKFPSLSAPQ